MNKNTEWRILVCDTPPDESVLAKQVTSAYRLYHVIYVDSWGKWLVHFRLEDIRYDYSYRVIEEKSPLDEETLNKFASDNYRLISIVYAPMFDVWIHYLEREIDQWNKVDEPPSWISGITDDDEMAYDLWVTGHEDVLYGYLDSTQREQLGIEMDYDDYEDYDEDWADDIEEYFEDDDTELNEDEEYDDDLDDDFEYVVN